MKRPLIFGAAVAATALFVMSGSAASANAPAALPIGGAEDGGGGATVVDPSPPVAPSTPATPDPSGGTVVVPSPALPATDTPVPATPAEAAPEASSGAGAITSEPDSPTSTPASPADGAEAVRATSDQVGAAANTNSAVASQSGPPADLPAGDARPAAAGGASGVILERLLPSVDRKLRGVQTQMDNLQRRLAGGGAPPTNTLVRLRRSLELIAPALAALNAQVDSGGPLSPDLRQLLHRVNKRLDGAHVSAGALAAALRRSGMDGPELALLLRELEGFGAEGPVFSPVAQLHGSPALYAGDLAYTHAPAAPVAPSAPAQHASSPQREVTVHHSAAPNNSPAPDELVPQVSASGSASAGPGGAFSAAGVAALTALLAALALPRLLTRVQLMSARSYKAAFLVPLQRPG